MKGEQTSTCLAAVQLKFLVSKWLQMNLIVLEKPSIIKSRPFPHHQKSQVTIVCSNMIQSRDAWKSKKFHLHMTKSILFLILQVCSVFYLATNTNGTLRGLFYHLFSITYASLFFAVRFVLTFERLAKTFQLFKIFKAVIQDHLDIDTNSLLILYSKICCIVLCILQTQNGFWVFLFRQSFQ